MDVEASQHPNASRMLRHQMLRHLVLSTGSEVSSPDCKVCDTIKLWNDSFRISLILSRGLPFSVRNILQTDETLSSTILPPKHSLSQFVWLVLLVHSLYVQFWEWYSPPLSLLHVKTNFGKPPLFREQKNVPIDPVLWLSLNVEPVRTSGGLSNNLR